MSDDAVSLDDIRECLERSGYLLESRLVRALTAAEYFVEPNQVLRDARTGKSREIDLLAERHRFNPERNKVHVWTKFVLETINNKYPFVLVTPRPYTPNADFESYIRYFCTPEPNPFIGQLDLYELMRADWNNLFSQYCVLSRKKQNDRELMASHPDDVYGSILKLAEFVEDDMLQWNDRELASDEYWRLIFWHPMLVLSGDLLAVSWDDQGQFYVQECEIGRLEFNWHADTERRTTVIEIITEKALLHRLEALCDKDDKLEEQIHALRQRQLKQ